MTMEYPDLGKPHLINVQDRYIDIKKIKQITPVRRGGVEYSFTICFIDGDEKNILRNIMEDYIVVRGGELFGGYVSRDEKENGPFSVPEYRVKDNINYTNPKLEIEDVEGDYPLNEVVENLTYHFGCSITHDKVKDLRERIAEYVNEYQYDQIPKFDFK